MAQATRDLSAFAATLSRDELGLLIDAIKAAGLYPSDRPACVTCSKLLLERAKAGKTS